MMLRMPSASAEGPGVGTHSLAPAEIQKRVSAIVALLRSGNIEEIWRCHAAECKVQINLDGTSCTLTNTKTGYHTCLSFVAAAERLVAGGLIAEDGLLVVAPAPLQPKPVMHSQEDTPMPRGVPNSGVRKPRAKAAAKTTATKRPYQRRAAVQPPIALVADAPAQATDRQSRPAPAAKGGGSIFTAERGRIEVAIEVLQGQLALLDRLEAGAR